eukprot:5456464-Alexandrium_andersonii.AAC.1
MHASLNPPTFSLKSVSAAQIGGIMREFPNTADSFIAEARLALLQAPEPHRCGAARRYAWHAGGTYVERLN